MTPIPNENNRGEILFRVCAYALTGLQCTLYVFIFSIIPLLLFEIIPKGITIHSSETGYPFYESVFEIGIVAMLAVPNLLGWFLAFLYPLKKNSQTWGMKMFGLKAVHPSESQLSWKTALKQEGLHSLSCAFVIGLGGIAVALANKEEKTLFNRVSKLSILQTEPQFSFVKEFRIFRKEQIKDALREGG